MRDLILETFQMGGAVTLEKRRGDCASSGANIKTIHLDFDWQLIAEKVLGELSSFKDQDKSFFPKSHAPHDGAKAMRRSGAGLAVKGK